MQKVKLYFSYIFRGMLMGAADVIPGVSGGTIAFITGIYEKLIEGLNNVDFEAVKLLFQWKWKEIEEKIHFTFLMSIIVGTFTAAISLAKGVKYLLVNYEEALWSFFFGLIIASIVVVLKQVKKWDGINFVGLVVGAGIAYLITIITVVQTPNTPFFIFIAGLVSVVAMILPGISGSYILVIIDKYRFIIDIVSDLAISIKGMVEGLVLGDTAMISESWQLLPLFPFLVFQAGTLTGVLSFSKVLNWLFKKYHDLTIAILSGFMIGSLNKVWPWKKTISFYTDSHGVRQPALQENILPHSLDMYFCLTIILAFAGFLMVYYMEKIYMSKKEDE